MSPRSSCPTRAITIRSEVSIRSSESSTPRAATEDVAWKLRVSGTLLESRAFARWLRSRGLAPESFFENVIDGFHRIVRAMADRFTLPLERRRVGLLARRFARGSRSDAESRLLLRYYLETAAAAYAVATDRAALGPVVARAAAVASAPAPDARAARILGTLLAALVGDARDRRLFARYPFPGSRAWARAVDRLRVRLFLRRSRLVGCRPDAVYSRMIDEAGYLSVADAFAVLLRPSMVRPLEDSRDPNGGDDVLSLLPRQSVRGPRPERVPAGEEFAPGLEVAPLPPPHVELSLWYWERAPILPAPPSMTVTRLDKVERNVPILERVESREARSFGMPLRARPLRYRPLRRDDDAGDIDFLHLCSADEAPLIEGLTFGVASAFPSVSLPFEVRSTHVRDGIRRETVIVKTETELGTLGGQTGDVERILFVRDSSGSMGALAHGTKLDCVTLGIFSVLKTLRALGKEESFSYGAIDFSDRTHFSGFVPWNEIAKLEAVALTDQGGGTTLHLPVLAQALEDETPTLVLFLTDGALSISGGCERDVIETLQKHSSYVVASERAIGFFCSATAEAGITTLLLTEIEQVVPVFAAIVSQARRS